MNELLQKITEQSEKLRSLREMEIRGFISSVIPADEYERIEKSITERTCLFLPLRLYSELEAIAPNIPDYVMKNTMTDDCFIGERPWFDAGFPGGKK